MNDADPDPPLTVEQLADLQAGLLDDDTAAALRSRIRTDPQAAATLQALHQVRDDVAAIGSAPAPAAPPETVDRVSSALHSPGAAHAARPSVRPARVVAGILGLCAVVAAIGVGTLALLHHPSQESSTGPTMDRITVSTPAPVIPLSDPEILALLHRPPDFGALGNAAQRASCLSGLGYPASVEILGAQPIEVNARPGVLLVLPGDNPATVTAYAVAQNCSAADTGLLADTAIPRG